MVKVALIEDNTTISDGLIKGTTGYSCIGEYSDCESFLSKLETLSVDAALMDIGLSSMSGIDGIARAKKIKPELNILILTVHEDNQSVFKALCAEACGYPVKKLCPADFLKPLKMHSKEAHR